MPESQSPQVNDVFVPGPIKVSQVAPAPTDKPDEFWARKAKEAASQREYVAAQREIERLQTPEPPAEPPFKVSGGINLGTIDFQEQQRLAREETEKIRLANEAAQQRALEENQKLRDQLNETNRKLQETQFQALLTQVSTQLTSQISELSKKVEAGTVSQKSFLEQYRDLKGLSDELFQKAPTAVPAGTDPRIALEMLKIQMDGARAEREFKFMMRKSDLEFQRLLAKDTVDTEIRKQELEDKRRRDETFAKAPEVLGKALAAAMVAGGATPQEPIAQQPPPPAPVQGMPAEAFHERAAKQTKAPPKKKARPVIEAAPGEAGEIPCPTCEATIAVNPDTTTAICAKCGQEIEVIRNMTATVESEDEERRR